MAQVLIVMLALTFIGAAAVEFVPVVHWVSDRTARELMLTSIAVTAVALLLIVIGRARFRARRRRRFIAANTAARAHLFGPDAGTWATDVAARRTAGRVGVIRKRPRVGPQAEPRSERAAPASDSSA